MSNSSSFYPELLTWQNCSPAVRPLLEMLEQQIVGDGPHAAAAVADVVQQLLLGNVPVTVSKSSPSSPHLEVYEHAGLGVGVALDLVECHQQPVA